MVRQSSWLCVCVCVFKETFHFQFFLPFKRTLPNEHSYLCYFLSILYLKNSFSGIENIFHLSLVTDFIVAQAFIIEFYTALYNTKVCLPSALFIVSSGVGGLIGRRSAVIHLSVLESPLSCQLFISIHWTDIFRGLFLLQIWVFQLLVALSTFMVLY